MSWNEGCVYQEDIQAQDVIGVWQGEGQPCFGAATGLDMAEGLKIKNLADVI